MELMRLGVFWEAKEREEEREEREWEKEVVGALESLKPVSVTDGWVLSLSSFEVISVLTLHKPPADHAFHFPQLHIILDRAETLEVFTSGLVDGSFSKTSFEYVLLSCYLVSAVVKHQTDLPLLCLSRYAPLCHFFAHLCLFLQMIDIPVPPLATQAILEAYLQVLEVCLSCPVPYFCFPSLLYAYFLNPFLLPPNLDVLTYFLSNRKQTSGT
jgi:nuclear pore complex protein Nup107